MHKTRKNKSMRFLSTGIKGQGKYLKGWSKQQPNTHQRTLMTKCGKKCFLGPNKTFPICTKNTCKVNKKGIYAAYIRAREYETIKGSKKYSQIASKAYKMIHK